MKILLTFAGIHDPFTETSVPGERCAGPILTVAAQQFDCVQILSLPTTADNARQTEEELRKRNKNATVEINDVVFKDPERPLEILKQLKSWFKKMTRHHPGGEFFICASSDVPHVDAAWLMLVARGEIRARVLHVRATRSVAASARALREFDFADPQSLQIRAFGNSPDGGEYDFQSLSADLCLTGEHAPFLRELKTAFSMAESDCPILLVGETNSGKESFARLIHCASKRAAKTFVVVDCRDPAVEKRLFGCVHGQGSAFEQADGGTLFLDDLEALPAACQASLLRAIEQGRIQRSWDDNLRVNVRVVAATNVDIKGVIAEKAPRQELYQSFYLLHFSARTKTKWDRLLQSHTTAALDESVAQSNIVPLPSAAEGR